MFRIRLLNPRTVIGSCGGRLEATCRVLCVGGGSGIAPPVLDSRPGSTSGRVAKLNHGRSLVQATRYSATARITRPNVRPPRRHPTKAAGTSHTHGGPGLSNSFPWNRARPINVHRLHTWWQEVLEGKSPRVRQKRSKPRTGIFMDRG